MAAAQSAVNHGVKWCLSDSYLHDEGCINQFQSRFTHETWKQQHKHPDQRYPHMEHLLDDHKNHLRKRKSHFQFEEKFTETETKEWMELNNRRKFTAEKTLGSKDRSKS